MIDQFIDRPGYGKERELFTHLPHDPLGEPNTLKVIGTQTALVID